MNEFKNSLYNVAVQIAGLNKGSKKAEQNAQGQLVLIDNYTMNAPILKGMPFQRSSHAYHHAYGDIVNVKGMQIIDFDSSLPLMSVDAQLNHVSLTPMGGEIQFGEDTMLQTHGSPEAYLSAKIPAILRGSGAALERSFYINNFLTTAINYGTAMSTNATVTTDNDTMVAITWTPDEMTGLHSLLPYEQENSYGQLFRPEWANNKSRHKLQSGIYGYAATVKMLIGLLLANKKKISALVNITDTPSPNQLAALVNAAQGSNATRIYCSARLKTALAAKYAQTMQGNGLVSVSNVGEISILGIPVVSSHNIPTNVGYIKNIPFIKTGN